jgi:putative methyltransferase (TIGR04325 family)
MEYADNGWLAQKLRHIANESAELPVLNLLGKPLYRRIFQRPFHGGNSYYGAYDTYEEAKAAAPPALPKSYAYAGTGGMYRDQHEKIRVSDYPLLYWVKRLLDAGERDFFDLGGHVGVTYYGFRRYADFPDDLRWTVHDVPDVMEAGTEWAAAHDPERRLRFAPSRHDASGHGVLLTSGALQYLDYTLPELLSELAEPPRHVLVNLVPMHPSRGYFTLQNIGKAVLPYRVSAIPEFVAAMEALGYAKLDQWHSQERYLRVPFEPGCRIDGYSGFAFRRGG